MLAEGGKLEVPHRSHLWMAVYFRASLYHSITSKTDLTGFYTGLAGWLTYYLFFIFVFDIRKRDSKSKRFL